MTTLILPSVTPVPVPPKAKPVNRPQIIDEYGFISEKLEGLRHLVKRHEQLRRMILAWYEGSDPEQQINEDGKKFSVSISPQALERRIVDMKWVLNRLGEDRFLSLVTLALAKLDKFIPLADQDEFTCITRCGPRTVKPVSKFEQPA